MIEIYKRLDLEGLRKIYSSLEYYEGVVRSVNRLAMSAGAQDLVIAVPDLSLGRNEDLEGLDRMVELVAYVMGHSRVDVMCTPVFSRTHEGIYRRVLEAFLDVAGSLGKPTALSLPRASQKTRDELVSTYVGKLDKYNSLLVNLICVDYNGSNPLNKYSEHNYALHLSRLMERSYGEPAAIYGVNVKYGKLSHRYDEIAARDLISPYAGLDAMGPNHRRPPINVEARIDDPLTRTRLLSTRRYTYLSISKIAREPEAHEDRHVVEELRTRSAGWSHIKAIESYIRTFNSNKLGAELQRLQEIFTRGDPDPRKYLHSRQAFKIDGPTIEHKLAKYLRIVDHYRRTQPLF